MDPYEHLARSVDTTLEEIERFASKGYLPATLDRSLSLLLEGTREAAFETASIAWVARHARAQRLHRKVTN